MISRDYYTICINYAIFIIIGIDYFSVRQIFKWSSLNIEANGKSFGFFAADKSGVRFICDKTNFIAFHFRIFISEVYQCGGFFQHCFALSVIQAVPGHTLPVEKILRCAVKCKLSTVVNARGSGHRKKKCKLLQKYVVVFAAFRSPCCIVSIKKIKKHLSDLLGIK